MPEAGPDLDAFNAALNGPVYVVTVASGDKRAGCLVAFASQCSIDPPRFVVWLSTANHTHAVARGARHLTVHLLHRDQRALAELFGCRTGNSVDKFARTGWRPGHDGSPVLSDAADWFTGRIVGVLPGGDHEGFLLSPVEESPPAPGPVAPPLRYADVRDLEPGHPA
ncbi:flavin reductase family protein [Streptomyces sp. NPDC127106]|uniref:flavin reductase family protein n=1 Tax=Streptomyces sp. NPDC127106 TaxID=3345360 RepID=UPI003634789E